MSFARTPKAIVIGSGPNGLMGAVMLARAGFTVIVHEAAPVLGGGTSTEELTLPGFRHDVYSAVHPLALASPCFRALELELDWIHPPAPAAHPFDDGTALVLERDLGETVAALGDDGAAYAALLEPLLGVWPTALEVALRPLPPGRTAALALARALGPRRLQATARAAAADARTLALSLFASARAQGWFAGHAAHSMLPLERRPSGGFGLALVLLGHAVGWPFPRGGAQAIAAALATRLTELGGEIRTSSPIDELPRAEVVLGDVAPRELLRLARGALPERYERALRSYRHGPGAFKVDWALDGPIPWRAKECARAGTVHLGGTLAELSRSEWRAWSGGEAVPPFVLLAQPSLFDPTRAPAGKHTGWAYCHLPNGSDEDLTEAIEAQVERFAPGFRERVLARSSLGPAALQSRNRNLVGGDVNNGAMDLGQLLFRPVRGTKPYRTPLRGVYLCSAATPPGGGVHGMCGAGAARAALADWAGG